MKILTCIGGSRGKSNGSRIIEPVVHSVIEPAFLPSISWSGRGREKDEKIALSKYSNIINLISLVTNKADKNFTQLDTTKALKYKIIKYAPAKFGKKPADKGDENLISVVPEAETNG